MRISKKLLRLEVYIDMDVGARNLQILDYIKTNMKVPPTLKGRIEYERRKAEERSEFV